MAKPRVVSPETPAAPRVDMGDFLQKLDMPEVAGSVTVPELAEYKARRDLIKSLTDQSEEIAKKYTEVIRIRTVVESELRHFSRGLITGHGLAAEDSYQIDDQNGSINRVARWVKIDAPDTGLTLVESPTEDSPPEA